MHVIISLFKQWCMAALVPAAPSIDVVTTGTRYSTAPLHPPLRLQHVAHSCEQLNTAQEACFCCWLPDNC
jgi:hypothetical protein